MSTSYTCSLARLNVFFVCMFFQEVRMLNKLVDGAAFCSVVCFVSDVCFLRSKVLDFSGRAVA